MTEARQQHKWDEFLKFYGQANAGRKTRLGVFETQGQRMNDFWIEDGLPLIGFTVEPGGTAPTVEIALKSYSHTVENASSVTVHFSLAGDEDGIDVLDSAGRTTILRFEANG